MGGQTSETNYRLFDVRMGDLARSPNTRSGAAVVQERTARASVSAAFVMGRMKKLVDQ
jgi:hypothetical protein